MRSKLCVFYRIPIFSLRTSQRFCSKSANMLVHSHENYPLPDTTLHKYVLDRISTIAQKDSERKAFINAETEESITFKELHRHSYSIAEYLKTINFGKGDVGALVLRNGWEFFALWNGILMQGGVMTPVSPLFTPEEIAQQLKDSNVSVAVCEAITLPAVVKAVDQCPKVKKIIIVDPYHGIVAGSAVLLSKILETKPNYEAEFPSLDYKTDLCYLPYSSGTTGPPKGVMHTHQSIVNMVELFNQYHIHECFPKACENWNWGKELLPAILPFYHNFGCNLTLSYLVSGYGVVYFKKFAPNTLFEAIEKYKLKILPAAPPVLVFLSKTPLIKDYDLSSLKFIISGAAPLSDDVITLVMEQLPHLKEVGQGFGMTELATGVAVPFWGEGKWTSCGKLLSHNVAKICNVETGRIQSKREVGELYIKSPTAMKGYLNRPEATKEAFDSEGFVKTGDIGYFDDQNRLYVIDRCKELIKVKGMQVAPAELEALLLSCSLVKDAAVIGVADEKSGEVPKGFIVRRDEGVSVDEIHDFLKDRTASYKQLAGGIQFVEAIPKSPSGKILRRELRDLENVLKTNSKL